MASIVRSRVIVNVLVVAGVLAASLALIVSLIWIFQERIAFQPPAGPWPEAPGTRRVEYVAQDGQPLFAYIVGDGNPADGLLLSFHGNADLAIWQIGWGEEIARRTGITVMLAEYRGYMGLKGRPDYRGSQLDAEAAYLFARDSLGVSAERVSFFGHSLGTAIAAELAVKHPPASLILQSPFTSARDMAGRITGYRPSGLVWRFISRLHFDTGAKVAQIEAPVAVAHGGADRLIPLGMGEDIYAAARKKGPWLIVPNASHNDVAARGGEAYWSWMVDAMRPVSARAR